MGTRRRSAGDQSGTSQIREPHEEDTLPERRSAPETGASPDERAFTWWDQNAPATCGRNACPHRCQSIELAACAVGTHPGPGVSHRSHRYRGGDPGRTEPATHIDSASAQLNRGRGNEGVADKPASLNAAAPTNAEGAVNGESLPIDSLQSLAPEEREIVRQSEVAFVRVRATWECWKQVRAGLVVLRDLAMREAGANDPKSKLYKDRFHELLEQRAYCSGKMEPSTRKALLKCAELASQIDEWHDRLGEHRRLRLNHPVSVLNAFRKSQEPPSSPDQPRRTKHELELEKVRQEAVAAVSSRDERIIELQQQIDSLSKPVETFEAAESDIDTAVQHVVAMCGGADIKIRQVINALTACLEHSPS